MSFSATSASGTGRMGVIISSSGTHSPQQWAENCLAKLIEVPDDGSMPEPRRQEALNFKERVYQVLVRLHQHVQSKIIHDLLNDSRAHFCDTPLFSIEPELDELIQQVIACATGTPWEAEFNDDHTQTQVRFFVCQSFIDLRHLERLHFAETHPQNPWATAYASKYGVQSHTTEKV